MPFENNFEIRKLPLNHLQKLSYILDIQDSWQKLVELIPEELHHQCDDKNQNPLFKTHNIKTIERVASRDRRSVSEIILEEWGCWGRKRPTLEDLLRFLVKANLYKAADYVAVDLLNQGPVTRNDPESIPTDLEEIRRLLCNSEIEKRLEKMSFSSSLIANNSVSSFDVNIDYSKKHIIPQILISETPDDNLVENNVNEESDMIKFSTNSVTDNDIIPDISELINGTSSLPDFDALQNSSSALSSGSVDTSHVLRNTQVDSESIVDISRTTNDSVLSQNIPDFSALQNSTNNVTNNYSLPNLSELIPNRSSGLNSLSDVSISKSRECSSPLPNLSLKTQLPHFAYRDLEIATNDFNAAPYTNVEAAGRFLGSGSFGSVYLGIGLYRQPVAVKRISIGDGEVVNVDDCVTKQFCTEVEVLSKYQHENLLKLMGYSCDGSTYCLLYEYIPGGTLAHHLQENPENLFWTDRLRIALGTAQGISYLHSAFDTPLIHRDIKSENILLDHNHKVKVGDFGTTKLIPTGKHSTTFGTMIVGTLAYMSPEAIRGDISTKMDTFSFGVVLLELLTSLPASDQNRENIDLVTHIQECCEDSIQPLLDKKCGPWTINEIDFAEALFEISSKCLLEKKKRPSMVNVNSLINELFEKIA